MCFRCSQISQHRALRAHFASTDITWHPTAWLVRTMDMGLIDLHGTPANLVRCNSCEGTFAGAVALPQVGG